MKDHHYTIKVLWTGNKGQGTQSYTSYSRDHEISAIGKYNTVLGSSDPAFKGDVSRYNPEDLFLSSLTACHMLWYLHLCSENGITVVNYIDEATAIMKEDEAGGKFNSVTLNPIVTITDETLIDLAEKLHKAANKMCFIANSCNFKVNHNPTIVIEN